MVLLLIIIGVALLLLGGSGFLTYRIRVSRKKKAFMDYLKKREYDKIGFS